MALQDTDVEKQTGKSTVTCELRQPGEIDQVTSETQELMYEVPGPLNEQENLKLTPVLDRAPG